MLPEENVDDSTLLVVPDERNNAFAPQKGRLNTKTLA